MRFRALMALAAMGALFGSGCSDGQDALLQPGAALGTTLADGAISRQIPSRVSVAQRNAPLDADRAVTQVVGRAGGVISIPEAGFQLVIPPNSLVPPEPFEGVEITVTALAGWNVAYAFEPHGLVFQAPVHAVQDARRTRGLRGDGTLESATGAYFPDPALLADGEATVSEIRPTAVDARRKRYSWEIDHFSGYLLATDRKK